MSQAPEDRPPPERDDTPGLDLGPEPVRADKGPYRVLARKYRPGDFSGLIGQETLVRTLGNAFATGRIAHAFMLTGVRGVGKTTTARIVAKALNCIGPDGTRTAPTVDPCGQCHPCREIAESRSVDVAEMDAASRTGIDDIREIIDAARYAPSSCRYKVYIIDEVHMLSKAAFNGLLKTLEEPPGHVKFIFATTEIRKVPVTVLSRCQRFDLKRIGAEMLMAHLQEILAAEGVTADADALRLIARAAQGSVRDALSILDQAIALTGDGQIGADAIQEMLGLADRTRTLDLFEHVLRGRVAEALKEFRAQYDRGADALTVMQDLAALTHEISRARLAPDHAFTSYAEAEAGRARALAGAAPMPQLTRLWQMLLKALGEVQTAPDPAAAADMALIRLTFAADLPPTEQILREAMKETQAPRSSTPLPAPASAAGEPRASAPAFTPSRGSAQARPEPERTQATAPDIRASAAPAEQPDVPRGAMLPDSFAAVVKLAAAKRAGRLHYDLEHHVRLVSFEPGRIDLNVGEKAEKGLIGTLAAKLMEWTGQRWLISVSRANGEATLAEQHTKAENERLERVLQDPMMKAALAAFPGAKILAIRPAKTVEDDFSGIAMPEDEADR